MVGGRRYGDPNQFLFNQNKTSVHTLHLAVHTPGEKERRREERRKSKTDVEKARKQREQPPLVLLALLAIVIAVPGASGISGKIFPAKLEENCRDLI